MEIKLSIIHAHNTKKCLVAYGAPFNIAAVLRKTIDKLQAGS